MVLNAAASAIEATASRKGLAAALKQSECRFTSLRFEGVDSGLLTSQVSLLSVPGPKVVLLGLTILEIRLATFSTTS